MCAVIVIAIGMNGDFSGGSNLIGTSRAFLIDRVYFKWKTM